MRYLSIIILLCYASLLPSQELAPIVEYTPADYGADNQNWMISQDDDDFIYVANNRGLMVFNGSEWTTYPSPNNTVMRSVKFIKNKVYTGCYEDFGYWRKNAAGALDYTSLTSDLTHDENQLLDDQNVWNIIEYDEWVLFQTAHSLYFYNAELKKYRIIQSENIIYKVFLIDDFIYYHVDNEGIYKISDGSPELAINDQVILNDRVINISKIDKHLLIITRNSGLFLVNDNLLQQWETEGSKNLQQTSIFTSTKLEDGTFVLGTISNGIYKLDQNFNIEYNINQSNGLTNNTVLSLFEDSNNNIWAGLDNGINFINTTSPIKTYIDYKGTLGTVYATTIFQDDLYVGTNQGLFYKSLSTNSREFEFVSGTSGQVWSLFNDNNQNLLCGHHLGTFIINNGKATPISSMLGGWNFKKIPNHENLLLQGNYSGLYVLEKKGNAWKIRNKINGFDQSSRFFEITSNQKVFVNHEYEGVYSMQLDNKLSAATDLKIHNEISISKNSSLTTYNQHIIYNSADGIYRYNDAFHRFEKDSILTSFTMTNGYKSGKMEVDNSGKLWLFSQDYISYVKNDELTNKPEISHIPIPANMRSGVTGFENIKNVSDNEYILGTANGYLTLDLSKTEIPREFIIHICDINVDYTSSSIDSISLDDYRSFESRNGIITIRYTVPVYDKHLEVNYQYRLEGHNNEWSRWTKSSTAKFENLSFGDYTFQVRAKVGNQPTINTAQYTFTVERPWYFSNTALAIYFLLLLLTAFLINKAYRHYYSKQLKHEQINNEKALIQIQNEKLNQEIEAKNRELAISTMSIIKKNELLGKIKKELKKSKSEKELDNAIDLIDNNLNTNKDWKFFEKAFNNADKDFLDKIKKAHPELTPNDLKFCAYLRLNLSSKEIAPLLNISTKSVETKRYRLRKRLKLDHNESLVKYILEF